MSPPTSAIWSRTVSLADLLSGRVSSVRIPTAGTIALSAPTDDRIQIAIFEEAPAGQGERERLRPMLDRCLAHLTGADRGEKCSAAIGHGPGHQSSTTCEVRGPHTIHCATYGSADEVARWEGDGKRFTGHFDEPPAEDDALVAKWFDEQTARGALRETLLADLRRELGREG